MSQFRPRALAFGVALAALSVSLAAAQTAAPAAPAAAPPAASPAAPTTDRQSPLFGRPAGATLAPVPSPPLATAADKLPVTKFKVPDGFKVEVFASGVANAREMTLGAKGTVFVGTRMIDKVYALTEDGGKTKMHVIASGLYRPNGVAFHDGALYVAELSRISRLDKIEDNLDTPPKPVLVYDDLPKDEAHGWKFIAIGPDNKLYVPVGSPGNITMPPETHAQIRRINLDGTGAEVIARGVRNTVGFDWNPASKEMYFTDNGRDWVSEDLPNDELNRITASGKKHFGFPFCHQGNFTDPEFGWGHSCDEFEPPIALLGPHGASLGMRFYTGSQFPAEYKNSIFIARHGSWNRTKKIGGDIINVKLNPDGTVKSYAPFMTGFIEDNKYLGRPVDVLQMKDGSLLVSDDFNGAIYRISYAGP